MDTATEIPNDWTISSKIPRDLSARNLTEDTEVFGNVEVIEDKPWKCNGCEDTAGGFDMKLYRETGRLEKCGCSLERLKSLRFSRSIEITPVQFSGNFGIIDGLNSATELRDLTPGQRLQIEKFRKNPKQSFYLYGKTGKYKTTLAWALLQESGRLGYLTGGNTGRSLAKTLRDYEFKGVKPKDETFYSISQIETNEEKICVLIDDIEVMNVSDYSLGLLYEIVEKIQVYHQRLIITSNKSIDELMKKFQASDHDGSANAVDYCEKLLRRLKELCFDMEIK